MQTHPGLTDEMRRRKTAALLIAAPTNYISSFKYCPSFSNFVVLFKYLFYRPTFSAANSYPKCPHFLRQSLYTVLILPRQVVDFLHCVVNLLYVRRTFLAGCVY